MLDCDLQRNDDVISFSVEYAKFHRLGSVLVALTSEARQWTYDCNPRHILDNYCIIFGKILHWKEIRWHVREAYRLGMIDKGFLIIRKFGSITERVNAKNNASPYPKPIHYFPNGDNEGIKRYLEFWNLCKTLGTKETSSKNPEKGFIPPLLMLSKNIRVF